MKNLPSPFLTAALAAVIALTGCATSIRPDRDDPEVVQERALQQAAALTQKMTLQRRLDRVATPLLTRNVPSCGADVQSSLGARIANVWSFDEDERVAARQEFGVGERLAVLWPMTAQDSSGDRLQRGDVLVSVNGETLGKGQSGVDRMDELLRHAPGESRAPMQVVVERGGQHAALAIVPTAVCSYPAIVQLSGDFNAYNDGQKILVNSALMAFFPEDRDLAVVLGHELAHGTLGHLNKKVWVRVMTGLVDATFGDTGLVKDHLSAPFFRRYEAEADYAGLYMTAAAGYDVVGAEKVWREFGIHTASGTDSLTSTHPASAERYVALRRTVEEIQALKKTNVSSVAGSAAH